ncbi:hypothetical protein AMJ49_00910 [Parcubacteria bacterium DG_74_2]|nr:MAG: hypothetical protein AMJ49_00910 [Parcubacteria bacterium DG_74_2]
MSWLIITILVYLILAIVFLVDKYLLTWSIPNPKVYTFYIGALGIFILILVPFVGFYIPRVSQIILSILAGAIFIYALFWFNKALSLFEASRVVPAIGSLIPFFTFGLVYISTFGKETLSFLEGIAFLLLVFGSIIITIEKKKFVNRKSLQISILTAFLLSLSFVLAKYVYLNQSFWSGYIWIRIGGFLMAICFFLFFPEIREEILKKKVSFPKKTIGIFLSNQAAGAIANILQNWAIALAPLAYVALINALQGIQYVFLLIFTVFLSLKFPRILKEEISKKILFQKIFAILLIGAGLVILAFKG